MAAMLPVDSIRFRPTDEELLRSFLLPKVTGTQTHDFLPMHKIPEHDLYSPDTEPSKIWKQFGGKKLEKNREELELLFFTTLKRVSPTGSRFKRTIGKGCWKGNKSATNVLETKSKTMKRMGFKKTFQYKSDQPKDGNRWVLHELSLDESFLQHAKIRDMVIYRLRKYPKKKEKTPLPRSSLENYLEISAEFLQLNSREIAMAPTMIPEFYRFCPTDEELVRYYLYLKVIGIQTCEEGRIPEHDLYAPNTEPWKIWEAFGGPNLEENQEKLELFFFTRLKRVSPTDPRIKRTIGNGCWDADASGKNAKDVLETQTRIRIGFKKTFHYKNKEYKDNNSWILHELSLDESLLSQAKMKDLVVCRLIKHLKKEEISPHTRVSSPATEEISPHTRASSPAIEEISPHTSVSSSHTSVSSPAIEEMSPHTSVSSPATEQISPHTRVSSPDTDLTINYWVLDSGEILLSPSIS